MPAPLFPVPTKWKATEEVDKTSRKSQKKPVKSRKSQKKPAKSGERTDKTQTTSKKVQEKSEKKTPKESSKKSKKSSKRSKKSQKKSAAKTVKEKVTEKEKFEQIQNGCKNTRPVKYKTTQIAEQVQRMISQNESHSILQAAAHVIRFRQTSTMETCYHLDVFNPTREHILFRVESPPVEYLAAKPKIGHLAPGEGCTVFLLFSFRCPRLPDDLSFVYSIRQSKIGLGHVAELAQDKKNYTTKNARKIAKESDFKYRWHVATAFYAGEGELYSCPGPHFEGMRPQLDLQGQIFEDNYNPDDHDDKSENLPSAADS